MARLVVINRSLAGSAFDLSADWTTIGRADGNAFQLLEPSVSGRHCEVRTLGDNLVVRDLLSTNGTFVNDERVQGEHELQDGDRLKIGPLEFRIALNVDPVSAGTSANGRWTFTIRRLTAAAR